MKNLLRYVLPVALLCGVANSATVLEFEGTVVPEWKYAYDETLTNVEIPDGVTEIQKGAFLNAMKLRSIKLPKTLKSIGDFAFSMRSSLPWVGFAYGFTGLEIPSNVTHIGYSALSGEINLKLIKVHNLDIVKDLMGAIQECHPELVIYCEEENTVILPSHISGNESKIAEVLAEHEIKQDANKEFYFSIYDLIKDRNIRLGYYGMFSNNTNEITDLELNTVLSFYNDPDHRAFNELAKIEQYHLPENVSYVVDNTFGPYYMKHLKTIVAPTLLKNPIVREDAAEIENKYGARSFAGEIISE